MRASVEFAGSNVSAQFSARAQAIDLTRSWIDHAVTLGCPRVMVSSGAAANLAGRSRVPRFDGSRHNS